MGAVFRYVFWFAVVYPPFSLLGQLHLLVQMWGDLGRNWWGNLGFVLGIWVIPPLMCLIGFTVAPMRWRRFRPLAHVRWSVIAAIHREIDLIDKDLNPAAEQRKRSSLIARPRQAFRQATGAEEISHDPAR